MTTYDLTVENRNGVYTYSGLEDPEIEYHNGMMTVSAPDRELGFANMDVLRYELTEVEEAKGGVPVESGYEVGQYILHAVSGPSADAGVGLIKAIRDSGELSVQTHELNSDGTVTASAGIAAFMYLTVTPDQVFAVLDLRK